jgi:hypothetical protein
VRLSTNTSSAFFADHPGTVLFGDRIDFGPAPVAQIRSRPGSIVRMIGDYSISGSATEHINTSGHSQVQIMPDVKVTFTTSVSAPVTFERFATSIEFGLVNISYGSTRFQNKDGYECGPTVFCANGKHYAVNLLGQIYTGGGSETYLPGTTSGEKNTGGIYN